MLEICKILNTSGRYKCLYINVESAQTARGNVEQAMRIITQDLVRREKIYLPQDNIFASNVDEFYRRSPSSALGLLLTKWAQESIFPTILLIDEFDSLVGDTLVSVMRQSRDGYNERPKNFPQCVILCGVRDVRDYRIDDGSGKALVTGGSAYNINSESLRVGAFSRNEVAELYHQHTMATGQAYTKEALDLAYDLTNGQPWLVNALAYESCFKNPQGKDRS